MIASRWRSLRQLGLLLSLRVELMDVAGRRLWLETIAGTEVNALILQAIAIVSGADQGETVVEA